MPRPYARYRDFRRALRVLDVDAIFEDEQGVFIGVFDVDAPGERALASNPHEEGVIAPLGFHIPTGGKGVFAVDGAVEHHEDFLAGGVFKAEAGGAIGVPDG